jgi:Protein of unknown function (DUF1761)
VEQFQVNLLGILLAVIFNLVMGSLWYSPLLFGNRWTKLVGMKEDDLQGGMTPGIMLGAVGVALVEAFGFALLQNFIGFSGFFGGLFVGIFAWIAFCLPPAFNYVLYQKQPRALFLINAGNNLVAFAGMSLIIGLL